MSVRQRPDEAAAAGDEKEAEEMALALQWASEGVEGVDEAVVEEGEDEVGEEKAEIDAEESWLDRLISSDGISGHDPPSSSLEEEVGVSGAGESRLGSDVGFKSTGSCESAKSPRARDDLKTVSNLVARAVLPTPLAPEMTRGTSASAETIASISSMIFERPMNLDAS